MQWRVLVLKWHGRQSHEEWRGEATSTQHVGLQLSSIDQIASSCVQIVRLSTLFLISGYRTISLHHFEEVSGMMSAQQRSTLTCAAACGQAKPLPVTAANKNIRGEVSLPASLLSRTAPVTLMRGTMMK